MAFGQIIHGVESQACDSKRNTKLPVFHSVLVEPYIEVRLFDFNRKNILSTVRFTLGGRVVADGEAWLTYWHVTLIWSIFKASQARRCVRIVGFGTPRLV